jgi:hypothetical protein
VLKVYAETPGEAKRKKLCVASQKLVYNFRINHMVSLRKVHACRRPRASIDQIINFIHKLLGAIDRYPSYCILNCDETSWPVIFANRKIWMLRKKGSSQIQTAPGHINGGQKCSFTAMAPNSFSGGATLLYMLANGKTQRC